MSFARVLRTALPLVVWCGCSSGGSTTVTQLDMWPKFRHDFSNTGSQTSGSVETIPTTFLAVQVDPGAPSAISASPAVAVDNSVYVGSEGGTLLATDTNLSVKWRATRCVPPTPATAATPPVSPNCGLCPGPGLGPMVSSPAVYTQNGLTTIIVASTSGCLFTFQDNGSSATCTACFRPMDLDSAITAASFVSSATFTVHPITLNLTGIFIGATIQRQTTQGKLYAINRNGSLKWEFPRTGSVPATIGPVTSSPAFGPGAALYFTTNDGSLYSLTTDGALRWSRTDIANFTDLSLPFAPSPLTADLIYVPTTSNGIFAVPPDGTTVSWRTSTLDEELASSLTIGNQPVVTATPAPGNTPTPTPQPIGPTPTITPVLLQSTLFGITKSGMLMVVDALSGSVMPPSGPLPTPVAGSVVSSPALSADSFLVFGTTNGTLYSVSTATGLGPLNWPVTLTAGAAIRSSPAIAFNGTIYVGADDGKLYGVGLQ
jgi:outer membrane protein assembly factor BamB